MWQVYAMQAMDLARERRREAEAVRLARAAEAFASEERRFHGAIAVADLADGAGAARVVPSRVRRVVARALRGVGTGAGTVADAACAAATRLDRGTA